MTLEKIKEKLEKSIRPKTFRHVLRVEETGAMLAKRFRLDKEAVALGCLLHDAYKHWTLEELQAAMGEEFPALKPYEKSASNLLHGRVAARLCPKEYGVTDQRALFSMAWHTTGHPDFGPEEIAVFVADKTEAHRDYPGVVEIREVSKHSLEKAGAMITRRTIQHLMEKESLVHPMAVEAMNAWSGIKA